MKVHEYQAKELLKGAGVAVPAGIVAATAAIFFLAVVEGRGQLVPKEVDLKVNVRTDVKDALNSFGQKLVEASDIHDPLGINKQNARIKELENQLAAVKKNAGPTMADQIVTGLWEFQQANADKTGMVLSEPHMSARDSKSIWFKFPQPFRTKPEVHVCIHMLSAASLQIEVKAHTVSKEGFFPRVHSHGGNPWSDRWLTWIALPSDQIGHAKGLIIA